MKNKRLPLILMTAISMAVIGCSLAEPTKKPETGPIGTTLVSHTNPPLLQRFESPPVELYDIETIAGTVFEGIAKEKWPDAESALSNLSTLWQQTKTLIGDKKGVKEADEALSNLSNSMKAENADDAYQDLNKFMSNVSDVGKSYKLSPISDIITIDNAIRNLNYYVATNKDWKKSAAKSKELNATWSALKPTLEQVGILSEITKAHSLVNQIKDSVDAENKGTFTEQIAKLNESIGHIRDFFRGK